ncbi:MAG: histidinol dehydrogenase, partial [Deltaproteobacteria bacterium]|nr:histidinol dehydrogenase [Deltaproteobacteria bacterium]
MIRIYNSLADYQSSMAGRESNTTRVESTVRTILQDVRVRGDAAVAEYTKKFDRVEPASLRVADEEKDKAVAYMDPAMRDIWIQAIHNIETYHQRQKEDSSLEFFADGSVLGWKVTPLDRVGVYIPGGQAVYPSSLLMNVIPARIAGVEQIVVATPPGADGLPHKDILAAAALLEVDEIYVMGGAQAVGALAYGTKTIPAV